RPAEERRRRYAGKIDRFAQAEPIGADQIKHVAANRAEEHRQPPRHSRRMHRDQSDREHRHKPIRVSKPEADTPFTATPARLSPIAATIAPVKTGGISFSSQTVPETCTMRPVIA